MWRDQARFTRIVGGFLGTSDGNASSSFEDFRVASQDGALRTQRAQAFYDHREWRDYNQQTEKEYRGFFRVDSVRGVSSGGSFYGTKRHVFGRRLSRWQL